MMREMARNVDRARINASLCAFGVLNDFCDLSRFLRISGHNPPFWVRTLSFLAVVRGVSCLTEQHYISTESVPLIPFYHDKLPCISARTFECMFDLDL